MKYAEYYALLESVNYGFLNHDKGKHLKSNTIISDYYSNSLYEYERIMQGKYELAGIVLKVHVFYNRKGIKLDFDGYTTIACHSKQKWSTVINNVLFQKMRDMGYKSHVILNVWKDIVNNSGERAVARLKEAKVIIKNPTEIV